MTKYLNILISILLAGCASMSQLTGGDKDTNVPIILKTNLSETEFKSKRILIVFDEYVELNNPNQNIKLFPNHSTLTSRIIKKNLDITIDSVLEKNKTYLFIIDEGIKDNNEGNLYSSEFLFSTGIDIDTCKTSFNFNNDKKLKQVNLNIFDKLMDSLTTSNYDYQYKYNDKEITVKGLKENKPYYYLLYTDVDLDKSFDKNTIYFMDTFYCRNRIVDIKNKILIDTSIKNKEFKEYKKLYKSDFNAFYSKNDSIIYSTKDSALYGKKTAYNDTSIINELRGLIINGITIQQNGLKTSYFIKHYNSCMNVLNMQLQKNSEFYFNKSHAKMDTLIFQFDSTIISITSKEIIEKKNIGEIKFTNKELKDYFIILYKDNKINETFFVKEKEFEIPLIAGDYLIEIYNSNTLINTNIITPNIYKKITIKTNWVEEIVL